MFSRKRFASHAATVGRGASRRLALPSMFGTPTLDMPVVDLLREKLLQQLSTSLFPFLSMGHGWCDSDVAGTS